MRRMERVNELIRRELGAIISREIDVTGGIVTFTRVELSDDLNYVDIYFSVIPDEKSGDVFAVGKRSIGIWVSIVD